MNKTKTVTNWELLYADSIVDRKILTVVTNEARTAIIIENYKPYKLRQWLKSQTSVDRWKFLDEFGIIEDDIFNKMSNNTMCANLLQQTQRKEYQHLKNFIDTRETKDIIRYVNNETKLEVLYQRNKLLDFNEVGKIFRNNIKTVEVPIDEVKAFRNNCIDQLKPFLKNPDDLEKLKNTNFMLVKFKVYNNLTGQLEDTIETTYMSTTLGRMKSLFGDNIDNLPSNFNIPSNNFEFKYFTTNAKENVLTKSPKVWSNRFNDTEQYLLNDYFNIYVYDKKIEIEATSVLWSCPSCQHYLAATTEHIKSINKGSLDKLRITFKGNTELKVMGDSRKDYLDK